MNFQSKATPQVPGSPPLSFVSSGVGARASRLIRLPEVMDRVGLKRSTIYKKMEEGVFPRSRSVSPKCAVWVETEIEDWIEAIADLS